MSDPLLKNLFLCLRELPTEFFYFDQMRYILGGRAIYYTGLYLYATDCTKDGKRAARYDAKEAVRDKNFLA